MGPKIAHTHAIKINTHSLQQEETNLQMGSKAVLISSRSHSPTHTCGGEQISIILKSQTQELSPKQDYHALNLDIGAF